MTLGDTKETHGASVSCIKIVYLQIMTIITNNSDFFLACFQDREWDTTVQFLPASDNKKLEKKKGPGKVGAVIGVVIFAAVVALMAGLLVWHFHCEFIKSLKKDERRTLTIVFLMSTF